MIKLLKKAMYVAVVLTILMLVIYFAIFARPHPSNPEEALISFEDLEAFISTFEIAQTNNHAIEIYEENYFSRGTYPVKTYVSSFDASAELTSNDIRQRPDLYEVLLTKSSEIIETESEIRVAYNRFEERYPRAVYPPISILYGAYKARALIRPSQVLIAGEYFVGGDDIDDLENLNNLNGLMKRPLDLPGQVIHELAHIQQARRNPIAVLNTRSLLNWAIYEGTADYIAFIINGNTSNQAAHSYLVRNEEPLWCSFIASTELMSNSNWINQEQFGEPPRGVAIVIGYYIAEAFYNQNPNKDEAFSELLALDYEQIYLESGINSRFENSCG